MDSQAWKLRPLLLEGFVGAVAAGEEVGDEVFHFFLFEGVDEAGRHEGNFGDFAFGNL